jgi:ubiquitin-protein ligase/DNA-directed RNA polymerase subunit RPC12/RpoP
MYRICYNIKSLYAGPDGSILERNEHVLEISLGMEYPRRAPQLRLLTPLFHPNFNQTEVCAQDNYAASEGLDELIIRIGEMIAFQKYNTKSPLNGIAAKWAAENCNKLPVDNREISPPPPETRSAVRPPSLPTETSVASTAEWTSGIVITEDEIGPESNPEESPNNFDFDCPHCQIRLRSSTRDAGAIFDCPSCRMSIAVPFPHGDDEPAESATIIFTCPFCGQSLEAESDMDGDKIECPACSKPITVGG